MTCVVVIGGGIGYGHRTGSAVALAGLPPPLGIKGAEFSVRVPARICPARLTLRPTCDPGGTPMRDAAALQAAAE